MHEQIAMHTLALGKGAPMGVKELCCAWTSDGRNLTTTVTSIVSGTYVYIARMQEIYHTAFPPSSTLFLPREATVTRPHGGGTIYEL
jgi:hypothetical protein